MWPAAWLDTEKSENIIFFIDLSSYNTVNNNRPTETDRNTYAKSRKKTILKLDAI